MLDSLFISINRMISRFILCLMMTPSAMAAIYAMPPKGADLIGKVQHVRALPGDTFSQIGLRYDIGFFELVEANPDVDPDYIAAGQEIVIPSEFVLPAGKRKGIVINLAELRLYYFPDKGDWVMTEPVGIGRVGWETPRGITKVIAMSKHPTWYSPKRVREYKAKKGVIIPRVVPPGPNNPLGDYAIKLGWSGYLIHGTNDISGVGRRVSSGCIRMYPEDVEVLFTQIKVGTAVRVIDVPNKTGWYQQEMYLEAHVPLTEVKNELVRHHFPAEEAVSKAIKHKTIEVNWPQVEQTAMQRSGIPVVIAKRVQTL